MKIEIDRDGYGLTLCSHEDRGYIWMLCWLTKKGLDLAVGVGESELQINNGRIVLEE